MLLGDVINFRNRAILSFIPPPFKRSVLLAPFFCLLHSCVSAGARCVAVSAVVHTVSWVSLGVFSLGMTMLISCWRRPC